MKTKIIKVMFMHGDSFLYEGVTEYYPHSFVGASIPHELFIKSYGISVHIPWINVKSYHEVESIGAK